MKIYGCRLREGFTTVTARNKAEALCKLRKIAPGLTIHKIKKIDW